MTRAGTCQSIEGVVRVMRDGWSRGPRSICIQVGSSRMACELFVVCSDDPNIELYRFRGVYRIGKGFKIMRFIAEFEDGRNDVFGSRYFISKSEDIGRKVKVPRRAVSLLNGINVIGFFRYSLGLGEAARQMHHCLKRCGIPCVAVNAPALQSGSLSDDFDERRMSYHLGYSINLFHLNPPEMELVRKNWPSVFKNQQYNIGYWFFELPRLPESWVTSFHGLNEVWVASQFVYDAVRAVSDIPVYIVPTAVELVSPRIVDRSAFGIPEDAFCVLSVFDLNSHRLRKNPEAAIQAFKIANQHVEGMHLILKLNNADKDLGGVAVLTDMLCAMSNVTMITDYLSRETLTALQACSDVFISLHRSEGLGLNLLECMLLEKPVIATNWSGNTDFMTSENSCPVDYHLVEIEETVGPYEKGQFWAEPSIEKAASYMIELSRDTELRQAIGVLAKQTVRSMYAPSVVGSAIQSRFDEICRSNVEVR